MQLKDYILSNLDQVEIFAKYLDVDTTSINYVIANSNEKINNPLRHDSDPSLGFKWFGNKLIGRDFADRNYRGDIFEWAGKVLNKNCNDPKQFYDICIDILENLKEDNKGKKRIIPKEDQIISKGGHIEIDYFPRLFIRSDYDYYEKQGISEDYVDMYIECADSYSLNGFNTKYKYKSKDPCYVFRVNPERLKLYFPFRNKKDYKFITNNKAPLECIDEFKNRDYTILAKSYKEKVLTHRLLDSFKVSEDFNLIPLASETANLPLDIVEFINSKTNKCTFTMLDTDKVGINSMLEIESDFGYKPIFFTEGFDAKDPTELCSLKGYQFVRRQFGYLLDDIYKNKG